MATIKISKHPRKKEIRVTPETVVLKANETLSFEIADDGFDPETVVTVTFAEDYRLGGTEIRRRGRGRGPFKECSKKFNRERGCFRFDEARRFDCGPIDDEPDDDRPRVWKYDVTWTGLPDLDPRVKIERGG